MDYRALGAAVMDSGVWVVFSSIVSAIKKAFEGASQIWLQNGYSRETFRYFRDLLEKPGLVGLIGSIRQRRASSVIGLRKRALN